MESDYSKPNVGSHSSPANVYVKSKVISTALQDMSPFLQQLGCNVKGNTNDNCTQSYLFALAFILDDCISFCFLRFCFNSTDWEVRWEAKCLHLPLKLISTCLNWHSCAVEAKWKQDTLTLQALVSSCKLETNHSVRPSKPTMSIHSLHRQTKQEQGA